MDTTSFNLLLLNLMIGLIRNHKFYRPLSSYINNLDYQIFGIERSFKCDVRDITPELMACSESRGHTVLWEATSIGGLNNSKRKQMEWYLRVTASDLINNAAVPASSGNTHSLWLIVTPDAVNDYQQVLDWDRNCGLMLSSFGANANGYLLNYCGGEIIDSGLSQIFQNPFQTQRIYQGYVTVDTSNLGETSLVKSVMVQLVSLIVRGELTIDPETIAKALVPEWNALAIDKKVLVVNGVKKVLRAFCSKKYSENMLVWNRNSHPQFVLVFPTDKDVAASKSKIYRAAARYQTELLGGTFQLDLDL